MEVDGMTTSASITDLAGAGHEPVHALLADGTTVSIRATTVYDLDGLNAMFSGLSA
jgi:hypothetical protein